LVDGNERTYGHEVQAVARVAVNMMFALDAQTPANSCRAALLILERMVNRDSFRDEADRVISEGS